MQVVCPEGVSAGGQMLVNVPAAPVPMAMAVPQPVPMVMAAPQPVVMAAMPVPATQGGTKVYEMKIDNGGGCEDNAPSVDPPGQLTMLRGAEWDLVVHHVKEHQSSNGFAACPCLEGLCFFTCCCLCVGFPCFVMIGKYDARQKKFKDERVPDLNRALVAKGMHAEYKDTSSSEFLVFTSI